MSELSPEELRVRAFELLCALDDVELSTPARLIAGRLVRLSYGRGRVSVLVPFQQRLGELCGVGKTHIKAALTELIDRAKILQIYPDGERYEILPDTSAWRPRPRCQFGPAHAAAIEREIDDRNGGEQLDLGELEMTFQPDPITTAAGEASRDAAFESSASCPPTPGAPDGQIENPPGIIRNATGGVALGKMLRRQLATNLAQKVTKLVTPDDPSTGSARVQEEKVTKKVTFRDPPSSPAAEKVTNLVTFSSSPCRARGQPKQKVTKKVTFSEPPHPADGKSYQFGNFSCGPRAHASNNACASDDFSSYQSSGNSKLQLSSSSSSSSDARKADEPDEADDSVAARMAAADDPLLEDLHRAIGEQHFGGWEGWWREAIGHSRTAAYHALAALKNHLGPDKPGSYAGHCFRVECRRLGRPFREIALLPHSEGRES